MFLETETLSEALSFARCKELPKKFNPELGLTWILAIALIKKKNLMNPTLLWSRGQTDLSSTRRLSGAFRPLTGLYPSIRICMWMKKRWEWL